MILEYNAHLCLLAMTLKPAVILQAPQFIAAIGKYNIPGVAEISGAMEPGRNLQLRFRS